MPSDHKKAPLHQSKDIGSKKHAQTPPKLEKLEGSGVGFVPVMTESNQRFRGSNRRRRGEAHFRETDPYDIRGRREKSVKKRVLRILGNVLLFVAFVLLVVSGGMILYTQYRYHKQDEVNEQLAAYATISDSEGSVSDAPVIDWEGLKAINTDVVGWIQIPGTVINFPVYQGEDNEHYLRHSATGEYSIGGQVFLDFENTAPGMVDQQSVIYGHHLNNGAMFAFIDTMEDQEIFDSVTTVWYVTEETAHEMEPLLLYRGESDDETIRLFTFATDEEFRNYLAEKLSIAAAHSADAAERIGTAEHVLSLVTCNYDATNHGRSVLVCAVKD